MSKWVKQVLSVVLVCMLIGVAGPLFAPSASASIGEDFDLYKYQANIFAKPEAEGGVPFLQNLLDNYRSSDYQSSSRIWVELLENDVQFMSGLALWEVYKIDLSDAAFGLMGEKEFFETALFAILQTTFEKDEFTEILLNSTIANSISLAEKMAGALGSIHLHEYDITDPEVVRMANSMIELHTWHGGLETVMGVASEILKYSKDVVDYFERISSYMTLVHLSDAIKACIDDLYNRCPSSTAQQKFMKAALTQIKTAANDVLGASLVAITETGFTLGAMIFRELTNDLLKKLMITTNPLIGAMLIGRDAGKAISNLLFGTDRISNQFRAMQAIVEIEKLMRNSLNGLESKYIETNTSTAAQTYLSSIDLLFSTYYVSNEFSKEFVDVAFGKGLNYWLGGNAIQSEMKELYESRELMLIKAYNLITGWWEIKLQIDYPELFVKMGLDSTNIPLQYITTSDETIEVQLGETVAIGFDYAPKNTTQFWSIEFTSENSIILKKEMFNIYRGVAVGTTRVKVFSLENPEIFAYANIKVIPSETDILSEYTYTVSDGKATITGYSGSDEVLLIPGAIDQYPVIAIGNNAFSNTAFIRRVVIPNGVTSIGRYAFSNCTALASITLPNSVTSIDSYAFRGCTSMTSITIPNSITAINSYTFQNCTSLSNVSISNRVTSILRYAFAGCSSLTSVNIPDSVRSIGSRAFENCTSLASVVIGKGVTSYDSGAFTNCPIENLSINTATLHGTSVYSRATLKNLVIGDNVTAIDNREFESFTKLTNLTIGSGVKTIGERAFWGCTSLAYVTLSNGLTSIGSLAFHQAAFTNIDIPNTVTEIGSAAFQNCASLTNITIPNSVTSLGRNAFQSCLSLENVVILNDLTEIPERAFINCPSLKNINIPDSVISIGRYAFSNCTSLTNITVPNSVTSLEADAFSGCTSLTNITIPENVNSIGASAFEGCTSLVNVTIADGVTSIGNSAFRRCTSLTDISIPNSVTTMGSDVLRDSSSLTNIALSNNLTSIEARAFYYCTSLTNIVIPDSVTSVGDNAFQSCKALKSVILSNGVTTIGSRAFSDCAALTSLLIPNSVISIGDNAFYILGGNRNLVIHCYKDSKAHVYAVDNRIQFVLLDGEGDISKVALNARIDDLKDTPKGNYANESWTVFQSALSNAQAIASNASATQAQINTAFAALNIAYAGLSEESSSTTYAVTVNSGTGGGNFAANATVNITANTAPSGKVFDKWITVDGVVFANENAASTSFTMPAKNVTVTATYKNVPANTYTVTVNSGSGGGNHVAGSTVNITANAAPSGKEFDKWTTTDGVAFASVNATSTSFTMPAKHVTVTATYKDATTSPTDKEALNNRINAIGNTQKGKYTDASWNAFQTALINARDVTNQASATQAQIDAALSALNTAHGNLAERILYTQWPKTTWNWIMFFVLFGFIWMTFIKP